MISIEQLMVLIAKNPKFIAEEYFITEGFTFQKNLNPNLVWEKRIKKKVSEAVGLVIQNTEVLFSFYSFYEEKIYKNFFDTAITNFGFKLFEDNNYSILVGENYVLFFSIRIVDNQKLFSILLSKLDNFDFSKIHLFNPMN